MSTDDFGTTLWDHQLSALNQIWSVYRTGNPTALHEGLEYCKDQKLPLPDWLTEELQVILKNYFLGEKDDRTGVGRHARMLEDYRAKLTKQVRIEAFKTVRRWQADITRYDDMPTRCISAWFGGSISPEPNTEKSARAIACMGLEGSMFHCTERNLRDILKKHFDELAADQSDQKIAPNQPPSYEEFVNSHTLFGHWKSEIEYGLDKPSQLFGPVSEPPPEILSKLQEVMETKKSSL